MTCAYTIFYRLHTATGSDLDAIAIAFGLPSRVTKQDLFGGDLESDEEIRARISYCIGDQLLSSKMTR